MHSVALYCFTVLFKIINTNRNNIELFKIPFALIVIKECIIEDVILHNVS